MSQNKIGPKELAVRAMREARLAQSKSKPAPAKEAPMAKAAKAKKAPEAESKKAIVAKLLKRKNGCTGNEVKDATGWPSVSMPAIAKACGLALRKEKTDKGTRYYGTAA